MMDAASKKLFVHTLLDNIERQIAAQIKNMPEDWDGIELRWYTGEVTARQTMPVVTSTKRRKRDYDNEVLVRNL